MATATTTPKSALPASAKPDRPNPGSKAAITGPSPKCTCGCGHTTFRASAYYIPGHDARHAGKVARAIAGYDGKTKTGEPMNKTDRNRALDALPSTLLRNKASDHADRLITEAKVKAARAKADADRKQAVEEARKVA